MYLAWRMFEGIDLDRASATLGIDRVVIQSFEAGRKITEKQTNKIINWIFTEPLLPTHNKEEINQ